MCECFLLLHACRIFSAIILILAYFVWTRYRNYSRKQRLAVQLEALGAALVAQQDDAALTRAAAQAAADARKKATQEEEKIEKAVEEAQRTTTKAATAAANRRGRQSTPQRRSHRRREARAQRRPSRRGAAACRKTANHFAGSANFAVRQKLRESHLRQRERAGDGEYVKSIVLTPAQLAEAKKRDRKIRAQLAKAHIKNEAEAEKKALATQESGREAAPPKDEPKRGVIRSFMQVLKGGGNDDGGEKQNEAPHASKIGSLAERSADKQPPPANDEAADAPARSNRNDVANEKPKKKTSDPIKTRSFADDDAQPPFDGNRY